jgi:acyl-CoA reductase-like NAD-dependent aldehyde dehydrogenase
MATLQCISPVDGSVYVERQTASAEEIQNALAVSAAAQKLWKNMAVGERQALCSKAVDAFVAHKAEIAEELTWQMGRPITQTPGEVGGFEERARHMIEIADSCTPPRKMDLRVTSNVNPWAWYSLSHPGIFRT